MFRYMKSSRAESLSISTAARSLQRQKQEFVTALSEAEGCEKQHRSTHVLLVWSRTEQLNGSEQSSELRAAFFLPKEAFNSS